MTTSNGYVSRDKLFSKPVKRRYADAQIEGFGLVRMRSLTARDKSRFDAAALDSKGRVNTKSLLTANARLIVICLVDSEGNPIFSDNDVDKLLDMDSGVIEKLSEACGVHCGITGEEPEGN